MAQRKSDKGPYISDPKKYTAEGTDDFRAKPELNPLSGEAQFAESGSKLRGKNIQDPRIRKFMRENPSNFNNFNYNLLNTFESQEELRELLAQQKRNGGLTDEELLIAQEVKEEQLLLEGMSDTEKQEFFAKKESLPVQKTPEEVELELKIEEKLKNEVDPFDCSGNNITPELMAAKAVEYEKIRKYYNVDPTLAPDPVYEVWKNWIYAIPFTVAFFFASVQVVQMYRKHRLEEKKKMLKEIKELGGDYNIIVGDNHAVVGANYKQMGELDEEDYKKIDAMLGRSNQYLGLFGGLKQATEQHRVTDLRLTK